MIQETQTEINTGKQPQYSPNAVTPNGTTAWEVRTIGFDSTDDASVDKAGAQAALAAAEEMEARRRVIRSLWTDQLPSNMRDIIPDPAVDKPRRTVPRRVLVPVYTAPKPLGHESLPAVRTLSRDLATASLADKALGSGCSYEGVEVGARSHATTNIERNAKANAIRRTTEQEQAVSRRDDLAMTRSIVREPQDDHESSALVPKLSALAWLLERRPWALLNERHPITTVSRAVMTKRGMHNWVVQPHPEFGLPGSYDSDIYIALLYLYNEARRPVSGEFVVPYAELLRVMRKTHGGGAFATLERSLYRLSGTMIRSDVPSEGHPNAATLLRQAPFPILAAVLSDDTPRRRAATVCLSTPIAETISTHKWMRLLDVDQYFSLRLPSSRRLYRYIECRRQRGLSNGFVTLPVAELRADLPLSTHAVADTTKALVPAHKELLDNGIVQSAVCVKSGRRDGKPTPAFRYVFARSASCAPKSATRAAPTTTGERVTWQVERILDVLGDEHSRGFYNMCARLVHPDAVGGILGEVREGMRSGRLTLEAAKRIFTTEMKTRLNGLAK